MALRDAIAKSEYRQTEIGRGRAEPDAGRAVNFAGWYVLALRRNPAKAKMPCADVAEAHLDGAADKRGALAAGENGNLSGADRDKKSENRPEDGFAGFGL